MSDLVRYHVTIVRTLIDQYDVIADDSGDAAQRCIDSLDGEPVEGVAPMLALDGGRHDLTPHVVVNPIVIAGYARIVFYLMRWLS